MSEARPEGYQYGEIMRRHLGGDMGRVFDGSFIYPRQVEMHLPGDGKAACNFFCYHCQGRLMDQGLGRWEEKGLKLLEKLAGGISYYVYGGQYTEPLMSPWLGQYLELTKGVGADFGIHTNGALLLEYCELLARIGTSGRDYVSISLDAGCAESHSLGKRVGKEWFGRIVEGIRELVHLRGDRPWPSVRVVYLMDRFNASEGEIARIVELAKEIGVDSLRFSVPYAMYNLEFGIVENYRDEYEVAFGKACAERVSRYVSKSVLEKPYIFWLAPGFQDVRRMTYRQCIYSYYQITLGADGWFYRCSSTATGSFEFCRLGKITADLEEFKRVIMANQNPEWDAGTCFRAGARCNRVALEINETWAGRNEA